MPRNAALPAVAVPALPSTPQHFPIRHESDHAANAVAKFCGEHPEYGRLGTDVVEQVMATYRTDEEHETLRKLRDEGVPVDRRVRWSDDA